MAIRKLPSGNFQASLAWTDGTLVTATFPTSLEAEEQVVRWKREKREGRLKGHSAQRATVEDLFRRWYADQSANQQQSGWLKARLQQYGDYVHPVLGTKRLREVRPHMVQDVLTRAARKGKSAQTQRHVFNLMRRLFREAIETYELAHFNPALRQLKPKVPVKEARRLNPEQACRLLVHVEGKRYGLAIWLQLFMGLRVGELQALRWEDLDLSEESKLLTIRRTYVRLANAFKDYPKGGKQSSHRIPDELWERLVEARGKAKGDLVVTSPEGSVVPYNRYLATLRCYCKEAGVPSISTHGIRHSTAALYLANGATRDDVRRLLRHSDPKLTDRYAPTWGSNIDVVASRLRLIVSKPSTKTLHAAEALHH
jgi:integrase